MNGRIGLLGALLGVQLIVVALVWFARAGVGEAGPGTLFDFAPESADELRVSGSDDGAAVVIRRVGEGWQLDDGLPADSAKVTEVVDQLAGLQATWAVATSASARERFEVAADKHQRHVVVSGGGETLADLYTGTSPGYQRVHARAADGDAVFSVALSNFQLPTEADEWLDRTLLQPDGDIVALERLGEWRLERGETGWSLAGGGAVDAEAIAGLVRRFAELRVTGRAEAPAADARPVAEFRITDAAGEDTLTLFGSDADEAYVVRSSRRPEDAFALASYQAERLLEGRAALLGESTPGVATPGDDARAE